MVHNIGDITPGGTATQLKSTRTPANWLLVTAPAANSGSLRLGDSTTGAATGIEVIKGTTTLFPAISDDAYMDLSMIYLYGTSSDKASIVYGTH
jgi:hypothetical protein